MNYTITKEQIDRIARMNRSMAEEMFPDAFREKVEAGKWYKVCYTGIQIQKCENEKSYLGDLIFVLDTDKKSIKENSRFIDHSCPELTYDSHALCYGIDGSTKLFADPSLEREDLRLATDEEVKEALIEEAKKRGLVEGVYIKSPWLPTYVPKSPTKLGKLYGFDDNQLYISNPGDTYTLFDKGVWAEPIKEKKPKRISIEKAEKKLRKLTGKSFEIYI